MSMYLETANLKLAIDTGLVWRKRSDGEAEYLGPADDDWYCPIEFIEEWEYLRIEWIDAVRCGEAYRATVEHAYRAGRWDPCCN